MENKLHYNTVTPLLKKILLELMTAEIFNSFRLVGGTSLSLQLGHRFSVDIDLFTDAEYGSIDFDEIDNYLRKKYLYVDTNNYDVVGFGKSYYVGNDSVDCVKLDLFYVDSFSRDILLVDEIRLATIEEIISMKMDVISRGGRKKDFWDIHALLDTYSFKQMLSLHQEKHEYTHNRAELIAKFTDFSECDNDFDPVCLLDKKWGLIKLDLLDFSASVKH